MKDGFPTSNAAAETMGAGVCVLVVDDDPTSLRSIERILKARGFSVHTANSGQEALDELQKRERIDVLLLDVVMPGVSGLDVLKTIRATDTDVQVVMMTAFGDVDAAVTAVKGGAHDFLTKPFPSPDALAVSVIKAAEHCRLLARSRRLEQELAQHERYGDIVGSSGPMAQVYRMVESVAHSSATVLLQGESGTGKELVARAIHMRGPRADRPFVPVNCSAIPETLVEAELFGYVRGAFTGATENRKGLFEAAQGGTILLDEIGDLPAQTQVKLLRTLQDGEIKRVGATDAVRVDTRVIAATNLNLQTAMNEKRFREDLFYRLSVITISLPALRDRSQDIPLLAGHFLKKYTTRAGRSISRFSSEAMRALQRHPWPGNVRELENAVERAVVMSSGDEIHLHDLPESIANQNRSSTAPDAVSLFEECFDMPFVEARKTIVSLFEKAYAQAVLERAGGNVSRAAALAGLDRSNFRRTLRRFRTK